MNCFLYVLCLYFYTGSWHSDIQIALPRGHSGTENCLKLHCCHTAPGNLDQGVILSLTQRKTGWAPESLQVNRPKNCPIMLSSQSWETIGRLEARCPKKCWHLSPIYFHRFSLLHLLQERILPLLEELANTSSVSENGLWTSSFLTSGTWPRLD